jgi:hypothetical protein
MNTKRNGGFVGLVVLIIIALVAAKYFWDWSIFEAAGTPEGQGALAYLKDILVWIKDALLALWAYIH